MVRGFVHSPPNEALLRFAEAERRRVPRPVAIDIGCGAARNATPLLRAGWRVIGTDDSRPMLDAAKDRVRTAGTTGGLFAEAAMEALPVASAAVDLIVAHGIWNLARSAGQFRASVREAARVSRAGAGLFLFTFSRNTLPPDAEPEPGERFVFTQFSGEPQCFLTETQLVAELSRVGFALDPGVPFHEYNRPQDRKSVV